MEDQGNLEDNIGGNSKGKRFVEKGIHPMKMHWLNHKPTKGQTQKVKIKHKGQNGEESYKGLKRLYWGRPSK